MIINARRSALHGFASFFLFTFCLLSFAHADSASLHETSKSRQEVLGQQGPSVQTYDQLISEIRNVRTASQQRIEAAVEQEKVRGAWETGRLINEHVLHYKERAEYGKEVLVRLSNDLGISQTELSFMVQFARAYPNNWPANKLSWSHHQALLSINDAKEREALAAQAEGENWTRDQVREEVRKRKSGSHSSLSTLNSSLEDVTPGKVRVYRVIEDLRHESLDTRPKQLLLDLGFSNYLALSSKDQKRFKAGDLVQATDKGLKSRVSGLESDLFTYEAQVISVYDGDTFHAVLDLGFGFTTVQRVRLLRIDAPELVSADGKKAKEVLEKILLGPRAKDHEPKKNSSKTHGPRPMAHGSILIQSKELDQHGRPIGNVFVDGKSIDPELLKVDFFTIRAAE